MKKNRCADTLTCLAVRALLCEAAITPKPGLVDARNSGAHEDMDLFTFLDSASALIPYFRNIVCETWTYAGPLEDLIHVLQPIGVQAERDMFAVTKGVNTHKGAIFSLGILCAAAARLTRDGVTLMPEELMQISAAIAKGRARTADQHETNGARVYAEHGLHGILGEAAAGFPHVFYVALPTLRTRLQAGDSLQTAGVAALLHLIAVVDDTNIIARAGLGELRRIQAEVSANLAVCSDGAAYLQYACVLDETFIRRGISPGGCADLLAATLLVHSILQRRR